MMEKDEREGERIEFKVRISKEIIDYLKEQCELDEQSLIAHALAIFKWVIDHTAAGYDILAVREGDEVAKQLVTPSMARIKEDPFKVKKFLRKLDLEGI